MMAHPPAPHSPATPVGANQDARAVDAWFASVSLKELAPQDYNLVAVEASDPVETALRVPMMFPRMTSNAGGRCEMCAYECIMTQACI